MDSEELLRGQTKWQLLPMFGNDIEMDCESFTGIFALGRIMLYVPRIRLG